MTESLPPVSSELKGESADKLQDGLVADYLCATNPKDEEGALAALRKDEFRLAMAGMTPGQREMWNTLDKVDWKAIQREGLTSVLPLLFGAYLGLTMDSEAAAKLTASVGLVGMILAEASAVARLVESQAKFPKAGRLAKAVAALRVGTFYAGKAGLFAALGTGVAALAHRGWAQAAAQMGQPEVGAGGGIAGGGNIGGDYYHGVSDVNLPQPPAEQPPAETVVPHLPQVPVDSGEAQLQAAEAAQRAAEAQEAARQAALEAATKMVEVQPGDTLTNLVARAGGDPYGADFTNTVLQSADVLTGPQNPNRDMAAAMVRFVKANPSVNWRDAINGVGDLARQTVGGVPLKDAIAQATRMIYPGQEMKVVVGAVLP